VAGVNAVEIRRHLATMFEDEEPRSAVTRAFDLALALLIIVNVSCVILESVESIRRHLASAFDLVENASTAFFLPSNICSASGPASIFARSATAIRLGDGCATCAAFLR
jgi:hypothetical protein